ncbi:type II secretion system F family protein [Devosia rhodophyticola]|uniref:Type II secretion system F family protein n=1 Tax=Devosia rhodophyticola TaxID=3026423 RepID=A0ABY7YZV7_9HYPH|nr:type II secretion system F family protein [Devosia rhodophyticola]WDR06769.1 type II secretion system F family protein [Devosia rhodophyticola]
MTPFILAILAMICVGAVGFALVPSMLGNGRAEKRIKAYQGDIRVVRQENADLKNRDQRRKSVQQALKAQSDALERKKRRVPLKGQLFQAGMTIKPAGFIRNSAILGAIAFVILFLVQVPILFAAVFAVGIAYLMPRWYIARRRKRYQNKYLDELPNAVEAIVRGVKTGLPLNDSMRVVAKDAKEPVKSEFARVLDQQSVGMTMTEAVSVLLDRVPLSEVNFFVVVITVQQQSGGNLSEALTNLARVLRNRKKMKQKVAAMSAEAKASAIIIGALPFVVAGLVSLVSPQYLTPLWTTFLGQIWSGVALLMLSLGVFVMNRMVQFDF